MIKSFLILTFLSGFLFAKESLVTVSPNSLVDVRLVSIDFQNPTGVAFKADFLQSCQSRTVKADMYLILPNGSVEFQNRCFANSKTDAMFPSVGHCFFRRPVTIGTSGNQILLRLWKSASTCRNDADEIGQIQNGYFDYFLQRPIQAADSYRAFTDQRTIRLENNQMALVLDRHGGATYEFYNKRTLVNNAPMTNVLHSHQGAALQVAIHDHEIKPKLIPDSCDVSQGYWNPTQAGFTCAFSNGQVNWKPDGPAPGDISGLGIICDGRFDNYCRSASSSVEFSKHRMFNWDYGRSYSGPYDPRDQGYLFQKVQLKDHYALYDVHFENRFRPFRGPIEIPTFYFSNRYRTYSYPTPTGIVTAQIPLKRDASPNYRTPDNNIELNWISFRNSENQMAQDRVTIAWFYAPEFIEDISMYGYSVSESQYFGSIKFTNQPIFNIRTNKNYRFQYVVFPYGYDDVIQTEFGTLSVVELIQKLRQSYNSIVTAPPRLNFDRAYANSQLWLAHQAIDGDDSTSYSSQWFATDIPTQNTFLKAEYDQGTRLINGVLLKARMFQNRPLGFPKTYRVFIQNPAGQDEMIAELTWQPNANGDVLVPFSTREVRGVKIVPVKLGTDNQNQYYFQMTEIRGVLF